MCAQTFSQEDKEWGTVDVLLRCDKIVLLITYVEVFTKGFAKFFGLEDFSGVFLRKAQFLTLNFCNDFMGFIL